MTEAGDPVAAGELALAAQGLGLGEVIEAQVGGAMRLVMAAIIGQGPGDVSPFGEARAPPAVVLRDGVELGQVEGDRADRVEQLQLLAPALSEGLLVAGGEPELVAGIDALGGDAQMVDDLRAGLVDDLQSHLPQAEAEVGVLAIGRHEGLVETPQLREHLAAHGQAGARGVVDLPPLVPAGQVRVLEQADHLRGPVQPDPRAGLLQPAIG
ncbi:hypothetical protein GALL_533760 [mine drainage metagenome]|uniref:Uncharacterized protein n=1 Tax=mine drainage metagenome TaxID=410659 RepID=A0A1J5PC44_9ZZZZ